MEVYDGVIQFEKKNVWGFIINITNIFYSEKWKNAIRSVIEDQ